VSWKRYKYFNIWKFVLILRFVLQFHPPANIKKMSAGIPLSDEDRWDWLVSLRDKAMEELNSSGAPGVILTCSALKRKYRDVIRIAAYFSPDIVPRFVYLRADESTIIQRVKARQGHFMKDEMVRSQFKSLEEPGESESDAIWVDVKGSLRDVEKAALARVEQCLRDDA
jgi:gluconokinase